MSPGGLPIRHSVSRCFQVNAQDNVATMLEDGAELAQVVGQNPRRINLQHIVPSGHKVALTGICAGQPIVKFGQTIGRATQEIRTGQWVHLHNCASNYDERSQTLELHSGATTDTKYD